MCVCVCLLSNRGLPHFVHAYTHEMTKGCTCTMVSRYIDMACVGEQNNYPPVLEYNRLFLSTSFMHIE